MWEITLPYVPLSVNRLYRPTEQHGRRVLTDAAKVQREYIAKAAKKAGFQPVRGCQYGLRVVFTFPHDTRDWDNPLKQLLDAVFGATDDKQVNVGKVFRRVEAGVSQTDITIWVLSPGEVPNRRPAPPEDMFYERDMALALAGGVMMPFRRTVRR